MRYLIILIFLSGCLSGELLSLSKEYAASIIFFDQAQKNLRKIYSDCEYDKDCFQKNSETHIKNDFCPKYKEYNFVSESECNRAGKGVRDLVSGEKEISVPIRNTAQEAHNDRMYELEKEKLSQLNEGRGLERQERYRNKMELKAEQQRQSRDNEDRIERIRNLFKACFSDLDICINSCIRLERSKQKDCKKRCGSEHSSCESRARATQ